MRKTWAAVYLMAADVQARERDCATCGARCCRHVAIGIDRPTCKRDYDYIRWYLLHHNVTVFVDHHRNWFVEFPAPCLNLTADNRCGDYPHRPNICRKYPSADEWCEYETDASPYRHVFHIAAEFERFLDEKGTDWRWR